MKLKKDDIIGLEKQGRVFYMEILKVENLSKIYGKGENELKAVDGISFDHISFSVEEGEFVSIIGPSGSRKIYHASHFRWC